MPDETLRARSFGRAFALEDCTVRADGDGRVVEAYAAALETPAEIHDQDGHYDEILARGSFDKTIAENGTRFGVFYNHARTIYGTPDGQLSVPIGVPLEAPRADDHGIFTVTRYLDNPLADSVLDAIKQRAITAQSFSGRFVRSVRTPSRERGGRPTIRRTEVAMREYGPTVFPAYAAAMITGTRSAEMWLADLASMDEATRADLFRQMLSLTTPPGSPSEPGTGIPPAAHAEEPPPVHSTRQADIARRIRVARIAKGL
jgi:HK97 family phage prohead protease